MPKCKIYVVYDRDKKIGNYTAAEAEEELGIPKKQVAIYEKNEWKYQGRYSFLPQEVPQKEASGEKKYISNALALDWDFTTRMLLAVGRRR